MKELINAKSIMIDNDYKLVVVKDGVVIFSSFGRGIKPVYDVYMNSQKELNGAYVSDRVTGKAAAMFLVEGEIKGLYTELISEAALEILKEHSIYVEYKERVPYILNRTGDDMCPIEKISRATEGIEGLIEGIEEFFQKVGMVK